MRLTLRLSMDADGYFRANAVYIERIVSVTILLSYHQIVTCTPVGSQIERERMVTVALLGWLVDTQTQWFVTSCSTVFVCLMICADESACRDKGEH